MRRWLWPYAMLAVLLSLVGLVTLAFLVVGLGPDRAVVQLSVFDVVVIEPAMRLLISILDMIAPFDLPAWFKRLYAVLALIALAGLILSAAVGLLLLPVFYALYRDADR
jgi:hypothetical protein